MRILVVEDDLPLGTAIKTGLGNANHTVDWATDGQDGQQAAVTANYDVILLDLGLPKKSGIELLKHVRSKGIKTPVIILTAQDTIEDRVKGLDAGADDYVVKPFDFKELDARIRAVHRRGGAASIDTVLTFHNIKLDPAAHIAHIGDEKLDLSRREFDLLRKLLENTGRVVKKPQLTEAMYGWVDDISSNALEAHMSNLRKKIGKDIIQTVRGVGYLISDEKNNDS